VHVVFVEPAFPRNQREFVRALSEVGARVTGIGERPLEALDPELKRHLTHYERIDSVTNIQALHDACQRVGRLARIDRLEAVVEAHVEPAAKVREALGVAGTTTKTAWLCRDKPAMKEALRAAGVPCARSSAAASPEDLRRFAAEVGYPLCVKPRAGAGASGAMRVDDEAGLARAIEACGVARGASVAVEEWIEGHEGFYDTLSVDGAVVLDFACHYYPNVLEAMRTRWISPQIVLTNRSGDASYDELKQMGAKAVQALGIGTSATHMEWFFGEKGLKFSEIGCRPPGVRTWDLYAAANEFDIYKAWAEAIVLGRVHSRPSRRYAAGLVALRPTQDGVIERYEGVDELQQRFGPHVIDAHLPPAGTRTQGVEAGYMANAWVRLRHEDYDALRGMLDEVGRVLKVVARDA
jgi:carbamoylphosphate synthase large subunit